MARITARSIRDVSVVVVVRAVIPANKEDMGPVTNDTALASEMTSESAFIAGPNDVILITGANGFIGPRVVLSLLNLGFRNLRCFVRPTSDLRKLEALQKAGTDARIEVMRGNLLSLNECIAATKDAAIVIHLAAGRGEKSFPDAFLNSVVTTRNLLEASLVHGCLRRFVNIGSFAVYDNMARRASNVLDETCPLDQPAHRRGEAYCFAKVKQDQIVIDYGKRFSLPYVIVRPGYVYGPGKQTISGRVGIDTFGVFLHLGGSNTIPFTYVDNCGDAIALAGLSRGVDGEIFNVVDDELPSSRRFLRLYKKNVKPFTSLYIPHAISFALCWLWERYSEWSEEQLPPVFNRSRWCANWRRTRYNNKKLKARVGWTPKVSTSAGLALYFESCRQGAPHA
jgi:nucleoside-diphosphate-sugar epimerase